MRGAAVTPGWGLWPECGGWGLIAAPELRQQLQAQRGESGEGRPPAVPQRQTRVRGKRSSLRATGQGWARCLAAAEVRTCWRRRVTCMSEIAPPSPDRGCSRGVSPPCGSGSPGRIAQVSASRPAPASCRALCSRCSRGRGRQRAQPSAMPPCALVSVACRSCPALGRSSLTMSDWWDYRVKHVAPGRGSESFLRVSQEVARKGEEQSTFQTDGAAEGGNSRARVNDE